MLHGRIRFYVKLYVLKCASYLLSWIPGYYSSKDPENFKYRIAVTAIIKNEGRYLREWIDYHLLVGIEHFYLYNNESTDNTEEVLRTYIDSGIVNLRYFPGQVKQLAAYHDALRRYRNECKYMAFIDGDEFIRPIDKNRSVYDIVDNIISSANDKNVVGVMMPWRRFGSSGYIDKPKGGGVLDNYLYRENDKEKYTWSSKLILNPRRIIFFMSPHTVNVIRRDHILNEQGMEPGTPSGNPKNICIHHYYTKSKKEWIERRSLGKADIAHIDKTAFRSIEEFYLGDHNDVYDDSMLYYAERLTLCTYGMK